MEVWRAIPGWEKFYEVSDAGRVRSLPRMSAVNGLTPERKRLMGGNIRKPTKCEGYLFVALTAEGRKKRYGVHQLVLMAFRGMPLAGQLSRHLNSEPSDNQLDNLEWATQTENMQDRLARGLYAKGSRHPMAKLTDGQVSDIKTSCLSGVAIAKKHGCGTSQVSRIRNGLNRA